MKKTQKLSDYLDRIERVSVYIWENLDEPLDFAHLAAIACFSPYHFHRVYRGLMGETVAETVKRLRLHRAAGELIDNQVVLSKIAERAGYSSIEAFSRAFRQVYEVPPGQYRSGLNDPTRFAQPLSIKEDKMYSVTIREMDEIRLAGVAHKGSYMEIGKAFDRLYMWASGNQLAPSPDTRAIGIYYDDPSSVDVSELRSYAGFSIPAAFDIETTKMADSIEEVVIKAGRVATLEHVGPYAELSKAYNWFYGTWLLEQDLELGDQPPFEEYMNDPKTTAPQDLITKINLSLKS